MEKPVYRVILWGTGVSYRLQLKLIRQMEAEGQFEVVAAASKDTHGFTSIDGYPLITPEHIPEFEYDFVIIMTDAFADEVLKEYLELPGASRFRAVAYRVLTVPGLSFPDYVKIRESRPTIFSNLCWGGILYRYLNLECCSPTKNLWIAPKPYLRMLENLEYYMSVDPVFQEMRDIDFPTKIKQYPVLLLDDIQVHCNHTDSPEQAISDWKRRREKINYKNIIAALIPNHPDEEERFYRLTLPCRKICFTPFSSERSYFCPGEKQNVFIDNVNHTGWLEQNPFDVRTLFLG